MIPRPDDRAVSIAVTHVLAIGITTILITTLLVGAGALLDDQRDRATDQDLRIVGDRIASELASVDRQVENGGDDVSVRTQHPTLIGGGGYQVTLDTSAGDCLTRSISSGDDDACLILESQTTDISAEVPIVVHDEILADASVRGGKIVVSYDGNELTVEEAET